MSEEHANMVNIASPFCLEVLNASHKCCSLKPCLSIAGYQSKHQKKPVRWIKFMDSSCPDCNVPSSIEHNPYQDGEKRSSPARKCDSLLSGTQASAMSGFGLLHAVSWHNVTL